jgi:ribose-phosphate pyrophosphokinase
MEKRRSGGIVSGAMVAGDVAGATVLIVDDLISTGGTMARAARAFRDAGAAKAYVVATHGLFVGEAADALADTDIERTFVSNTIPPFRLPAAAIGGCIEIVDAAPLFGEAIRRLHAGGSITELLGGPA